MKHTIIHTDNYIIRSIENADIQYVFKGLSHPEVIKYYGVSYETLEDTKTQMQWFAELEKHEKGKWWAIETKESQDFVGAGGFNDWDHEHKKAEIGFWLLPEYWGNGIMKETFPQIVEYGHQEMGLHRIEGFVESSNENCKRVLSKVNFHYEGSMRDCEIKDGKFISLDIYASIFQHD